MNSATFWITDFTVLYCITLIVLFLIARFWVFFFTVRLKRVLFWLLFASLVRPGYCRIFINLVQNFYSLLLLFHRRRLFFSFRKQSKTHWNEKKRIDWYSAEKINQSKNYKQSEKNIFLNVLWSWKKFFFFINEQNVVRNGKERKSGRFTFCFRFTGIGSIWPTVTTMFDVLHAFQRRIKLADIVGDNINLSIFNE